MQQNAKILSLTRFKYDWKVFLGSGKEKIFLKRSLDTGWQKNKVVFPRLLNFRFATMLTSDDVIKLIVTDKEINLHDNTI